MPPTFKPLGFTPPDRQFNQRPLQVEERRSPMRRRRVNQNHADRFSLGVPIVAVFDGGFKRADPAIARSLWENSGEIPGNGIDDDGNGYVDDVHGINTISARKDPNASMESLLGTAPDSIFHGTSVASLVAQGTVARVLPITTDPRNEFRTVGDLVTAVDYLLDLKARGENIRVLNVSMAVIGCDDDYAPFRHAVTRLNDAGVVVVGAAPEEGLNFRKGKSAWSDLLTLDLPNIVLVAGLEADEQPAWYSVAGDRLADVAIKDNDPDDPIPHFGGTSGAAPRISAIFGEIFRENPELTPAQAKAELLSRAKCSAALERFVVGGRYIPEAIALLTNPLASG